MEKAWIQLQCPGCEQQWEADPTDLPPPETSWSCPHCGTTHHVSEFTKTTRAFEILSEFHE